jgi:hypothetical protein
VLEKGNWHRRVRLACAVLSGERAVGGQSVLVDGSASESKMGLRKRNVVVSFRTGWWMV